MDQQTLRFPKHPDGLNWFLHAADRDKNLMPVFRLLKWSYIRRKTPVNTPEAEVALGMGLKYYYIVHHEEPTPANKKLIEKAERMLAASNAAIRAKKGNKDA